MPEPVTLHANGLRFVVLVEGEGPLVLLLHGFPDTPHTWDRVQPAVAALGFRVAAPFTRGYAPTEIPKEEAFDADTLARDALGLIDALGGGPAIVVGHDWGASTALSMVGLEPAKVRFLATMAIPHPASVLPTPKMLWTVRHFATLRLAGAANRIRAGGFAHIDALVRRWSPAWDVPASETDAVKRAFETPGSLEAALGYYRALRPWLPASQKKRVDVPAAAFAGAHDNIAPSAFERARSRYTGPYEVVTVPGGHFMHREHPEAFIRELSRVLEPYR